jgi:hypothetical protein
MVHRGVQESQALFDFPTSSDANCRNQRNPKTCPRFRISEIEKMRFFTLLPSGGCVTHTAGGLNRHLSTTFNRTAVFLRHAESDFADSDQRHDRHFRIRSLGCLSRAPNRRLTQKNKKAKKRTLSLFIGNTPCYLPLPGHSHGMAEVCSISTLKSRVRCVIALVGYRVPNARFRWVLNSERILVLVNCAYFHPC